MKLISISSLARSGSTFLQMLLSSHPNLVGLGEIDRTVRNFCIHRGVDAVDEVRKKIGEAAPRERRCSCGALPMECDFWGPVLPKLSQCNPDQGYKFVLENFRSAYPDCHLVDSSKTLNALLKNIVEPQIVDRDDVRVLFLVRDFRGWANSVKKHNVVRREISGKSGLWYGYYQDCYRWWYSNRKIRRTLNRFQVPHLTVSYEQLVFQTKTQLERIWSFLGVAPPESDCNLATAKSHDLYGNSDMKNSPVKRQNIVYDDAWLTDWRPVAGALLLLPVYHFNRQVHTRLAS